MSDASSDVTGLDEALRIRMEGPDGDAFLWDVPAGWEQGRGAYGGLIVAALTKAMLAHEEVDRAARALSASLTAPVAPGEARISVERLRVGNAVSMWSARLIQEGEVKALASLVTGRDRPTGHELPARAPEVPAWQDVPIATNVRPPIAPVFTQHFELRALPPYPFSGVAAGPGEASAAAWIRPKVVPRAMGPVELAAMVDVCWPTAFALERGPRPMATVAFHCSFQVPAGGLDPNEPLLHRGTLVQGGQGFFGETRELWTTRGELVCHNPQVFAWIK